MTPCRCSHLRRHCRVRRAMPLDMCTQVSHSYVPVHCATAVGCSFDAPATDTTLFVALQESRVIKSEKELEVMRYMNQVTSEAHLAVMRNCAPGLAEYAMLGAVSGTQGRCSPTPVSQVPNGGDLPALVLLPRWLALHVVHLHLCRGQQRCDASLRPRRRAERQEDRGRRDVFVRHGRRGACSACAVWFVAPLLVGIDAAFVLSVPPLRQRRYVLVPRQRQVYRRPEVHLRDCVR